MVQFSFHNKALHAETPMPLITASLVQAAGPLMKTKAVKHNHLFLLNICINKTVVVPSCRWRSPETIPPERRTPSPHSPSCQQALGCYYPLNEWTKQMECSDPNKLISSSGIEMKVVHYILLQTSCCFGCKCEQHAADVGKKKQQLRLSCISVPVIQGMMPGVKISDSLLATPGLGYRGRFGYHTNNLCCQMRVDECRRNSDFWMK